MSPSFWPLYAGDAAVTVQPFGGSYAAHVGSPRSVTMHLLKATHPEPVFKQRPSPPQIRRRGAPIRIECSKLAQQLLRQWVRMLQDKTWRWLQSRLQAQQRDPSYPRLKAGVDPRACPCIIHVNTRVKNRLGVELEALLVDRAARVVRDQWKMLMLLSS